MLLISQEDLYFWDFQNLLDFKFNINIKKENFRSLIIYIKFAKDVSSFDDITQ